MKGGNILEIVHSFKRYLKKILPYIVVKSVVQADQMETLESRKAGDEYIGAYLELDSFLSYTEYSPSVLTNAGITDLTLIKNIQSNINLVPYEYRDKVVEWKRKEILSTFEELNPYYRMLAGLPQLGDDYIYISPDELSEFGYNKDSQEDYDNDQLDKLTPLHKLPQPVLNAMDKSGYLKELVDIYKDTSINAEYVKYLGLRRINVVDAREASQYELLYVPRPDDAGRFYRDFIMYYEQSREYFLNEIYNYHFSAQYEFYEGLIGFLVLHMTIQRMINSVFEVVVERDFYDIETCRVFLESYGVPFIDIFTFTQQKTLVKNLNLLLMNKCTSQVLYDLINLLGYENFELTKYLLVKQHKTQQIDDESEPIPVFIYRTILDDNGVPIYELDVSALYEYYFVGVNMNETDVRLTDINHSSSHNYREITEPDELWIEDEDLVKKLQDDEINYVETKYTNIRITLRLQKIMFEHVYLLKMISDKKNETSKIMIDIPLITQNPVSLFELEVILICLLCKHMGMIPDLLTTPSKILPVLGFNFDTDIDAIRADIEKNPKLYDQRILTYLKTIQFTSPSDINNMYVNVREFANFLITAMQETTNPKVYYAYKQLYHTLLVTDIHNEVYALPDGSIPETYEEWLEEYDNDVYIVLENMGQEKIVDMINYISVKMQTMFYDTEFLKYLNPIDLTVINGLLRILRFFKSYTLDIRDLEIVYMLDSRYYNLMKMMTSMKYHANIILREQDIGYRDWTLVKERLHIDEVRNKLYELLKARTNISVQDQTSVMRDTMKILYTLHISDSMVILYIDRLIYSCCSRMEDKTGVMTDERYPLTFIR